MSIQTPPRRPSHRINKLLLMQVYVPCDFPRCTFPFLKLFLVPVHLPFSQVVFGELGYWHMGFSISMPKQSDLQRA